MVEQKTLDIEVESFSEREKFLIRRLREHYTIDREICETEAHARGDNLPFEPSVTVAAQKDDDMIVKRVLRHQVLKQGALDTVNTVKIYVQSGDIVGYAAAYRVVDLLRQVQAATV